MLSRRWMSEKTSKRSWTAVCVRSTPTYRWADWNEAMLGDPFRRDLVRSVVILQFDENDLELAIHWYRTAQDLPQVFPQRKKMILQSVSAINQILLRLGSSVEQRGLALVSFCMLTSRAPCHLHLVFPSFTNFSSLSGARRCESGRE